MAEAPERYDLAIISSRRGMKISPYGVRSLIRFMSANGYLGEVFESIGDGWTEVWGRPGDFAHSVFHDGPSTGVKPVFLEMGLRFGATRIDIDYGLDEGVCCFLEFRGAAFNCLTDAFLDRVDEILYLHPEYAVRAHEALRPREELAPEEQPDDPRRKRADRSDGRAGVVVEER